MNRFVALAAIALACLLVISAHPIHHDDDVQSQLSLTPSDDEEVEGLEGKSRAFSDFCLTSRDRILGDLKRRSNGVAGNLFATFFNGAENLGLEAVEIQRDASVKLGNQIRHPEAPIAEVDESNEVASIIADGQRKIQQNPSQPNALFTGIVSVLSATKNLVTNTVVGKLNELKTMTNLATATGALKEACDSIEQYDLELQESFEQAKSELVAHDPSLASFNLENVNCVTSRRIIRLDGICKFAAAAQNPLIKAITYKPITNNQ